MPKVTVAWGSTRPGGIPMVLQALARQTFRDFEVLFVDGRWHKRHDRVLDTLEQLSWPADIPFYHLPNYRSQPEGSVWTTPCAGFNTSIALAAGEIVVMLMDYSCPRPGWLAEHVAAHAGGKRLVMGPYSYYEPIYESVQTLDGNKPFIFTVGGPETTAENIIAQRENFDEIAFNVRAGDAPRVSYREGIEGPTDYRWCHTKNDSFPLEVALDINGVDEIFDYGCGPGDYEFAWRLKAAGCEPWMASKAHIDAIDMRWLLTNASILIPQSAPSPNFSRFEFDRGQRYANRQTEGFGRTVAWNPCKLRDLRSALFDRWRAECQKRIDGRPLGTVLDVAAGGLAPQDALDPLVIDSSFISDHHHFPREMIARFEELAPS